MNAADRRATYALIVCTVGKYLIRKGDWNLADVMHVLDMVTWNHIT